MKVNGDEFKPMTSNEIQICTFFEISMILRVFPTWAFFDDGDYSFKIPNSISFLLFLPIGKTGLRLCVTEVCTSINV